LTLFALILPLATFRPQIPLSPLNDRGWLFCVRH
jgi:hypothetical protein